jgi:hypothetical protein
MFALNGEGGGGGVDAMQVALNRTLVACCFTSHARVLSGEPGRTVSIEPLPQLNQPYVSAQFNMVVGRLTHYAIDALLLSTIVAGVKRSTGFACVPFLSAIASTYPLNFHLS